MNKNKNYFYCDDNNIIIISNMNPSSVSDGNDDIY